jgi:hypothetical protein
MLKIFVIRDTYWVEKSIFLSAKSIKSIFLTIFQISRFSICILLRMRFPFISLDTFYILLDTLLDYEMASPLQECFENISTFDRGLIIKNIIYPIFNFVLSITTTHKLLRNVSFLISYASYATLKFFMFSITNINEDLLYQLSDIWFFYGNFDITFSDIVSSKINIEYFSIDSFKTRTICEINRNKNKLMYPSEENKFIQFEITSLIIRKSSKIHQYMAFSKMQKKNNYQNLVLVQYNGNQNILFNV